MNTGPDGAYRIGGLCPGKYAISVTGPAGAPDHPPATLARTVDGGSSGVDFRFTK